MNVLIIKNVEKEGPGTIEDFLKEKGAKYSVVDFWGCDATEKTVPDVREFSHLVIMGGPMAVYESEGAPLLHFETAMIRAFMLNKKPVLGICLGAQMIAHALKSDVYAGGSEEVGWNRVEITPEGMEDPVFSAISVNNEPFAEVFQWHGDTFDLPKKTVRLASSKAYKNQAFRYKENVYALQFHIEVRPEMIREWFADEKGEGIENMFGLTDDIYPEYMKRAMKFYERFFA
ncbi:MAG: gamma-glutamyl-gamma-aminobutyrate hydrolase family protein [Nitrospira sp.]|nr:gamma-glutamyl-gamma-aminobutyrate hydrolase family protein [Nitrospira sp.]